MNEDRIDQVRVEHEVPHEIDDEIETEIDENPDLEKQTEITEITEIAEIESETGIVIEIEIARESCSDARLTTSSITGTLTGLQR